ncbi:MAG: hypothetical protein JW941_09580 [Candidatus Coatesbacteria bacterium]|nr:hypothetical protein [Candidatus Coatesbacteria bacterium]
MKRVGLLTLFLIVCLEALSVAQGPPLELSIKIQKDYYRAGDEFRLNLEYWNPGPTCAANLYVWINCPDLKSYYLPDWGEIKHPWVCNIFVEGGSSFGPSTIFEATLPDYHFPVWLPGGYQICAELVKSDTDEPLGPFAMAQFGVKIGRKEIFTGNRTPVVSLALYDGALWATGRCGVVRWDKSDEGWSYKSYNRFDGLCDSNTRGLYVDHFGNLMIWPYSGRGLTIYDGCSFRNVLMDEDMQIESVVTDSDMNMWAVSGQGILMLSRNGEVKWCDSEDGLPDNYFGQGIALANNGYPVATIVDGEGAWMLCWFNGSGWLTIPFPYVLPGYDSLNSMLVDKYDHIWCGTVYSGAIEYDGDLAVNYNTENSALRSNSVYKMYLDATGRIWFCCYSQISGYGGLVYYDGTDWGSRPDVDRATVTDFCIDFDGTTYIGSRAGIDVIEEDSIPKRLHTSDPPFGALGLCAAWDSNGEMYLTSQSAGVWKRNGGLWSRISSEQGLATDSTTFLAFDSHDTAWIGSQEGITKWDGQSMQVFDERSGLAPGVVMDLAVDARDDVWAVIHDYSAQGAAKYYLYRYDGATWTNLSAMDLRFDFPFKVEADTGGLTWVLNYDTNIYEHVLYSFDGQDWHRWGQEDGFDLSLKSSTLYCDREGNTLVQGSNMVTSDEFCIGVYDGNAWEHTAVDTRGGTSVARDCCGSYWFQHSYGPISRWDGGPELRLMSSRSGDTATDAWIQSCFASPEGDIYRLGISQVECYYMNPHVVAILNDDAFAPGDTLTLKYWAENPGAAERRLDLYILITLPTGDSVYLPTLYYDQIPYQTISLPAETAVGPVEVLSIELPDNLPPGEYMITPWFWDSGKIDLTGLCTQAKFTIGDPL